MEPEDKVNDNQQVDQNAKPAEPVEQPPVEAVPMQPMPAEGEKPDQEENQQVQAAPADNKEAVPADNKEAAPAANKEAAPDEDQNAEEQIEQRAAQENQEAVKEENPQDEEEEKAEAKEAQSDQGENPKDPKQGGELAGDVVDPTILKMATDVGVEEKDEEEEDVDPDRAFDTLSDLAKLKSDQDNADEKGGDETDAVKNRKAVMQLRKGNLYKAVIYARMLENGQSPVEQAQAAEQQAAPQSRFNRFLNSSKLNKAGTAMKMVNATSGLMGSVDNNYKNSRISNLITTVNDIMILINSVRSIIKRLRNFRQVNTSPVKKVFAVVGLVSDFGMAISKGAGLAKTIAKRRGWGKLEALLGQISTYAAIVGQIAGLTNVCKGLTDLAVQHRKIKKAQKTEEAKVLNIFAKYDTDASAGDAQKEKAEQKAEEEPGKENAGNAEEEKKEEAEEKKEEGKAEEKKEEGKAEEQKKEENEEDQKKEEKEEEQKKEEKEKEQKLEEKVEEPKKGRRRLHIKNPFKRKVPKGKVLNLLERPDVSAEDKAVLATYLARGERLSKSRLALANVSTGLITATLGLGASVSKGVMTNKKSSEGDVERATKSATYLGIAANINTLAAGLSMHVAGKIVNSGPSARQTGLVKEGLWGALHDLGSDDKYGLRKVSATLEAENPNEDKVKEASAVVKRYETASDQFEGAGVNYAKLFAANDLDTFKNSLVAGL